MDGSNQIGIDTVVASHSTTAMAALEKDGYIFKGRDDSSAATTVKYYAGDTISAAL